VWPVFVESFSEPVEDALLQVEVGRRGFSHTSLECSMHPFVDTILLGTSRRDALVSDAELKPPDIQVSQAMDTGRRERGAVIAADCVWKTILTKEP
jgi:hypothetical protein